MGYGVSMDNKLLLAKLFYMRNMLRGYRDICRKMYDESKKQSDYKSLHICRGKIMMLDKVISIIASEQD